MDINMLITKTRQIISNFWCRISTFSVNIHQKIEPKISVQGRTRIRLSPQPWDSSLSSFCQASHHQQQSSPPTDPASVFQALPVELALNSSVHFPKPPKVNKKKETPKTHTILQFACTVWNNYLGMPGYIPPSFNRAEKAANINKEVERKPGLKWNK